MFLGSWTSTDTDGSAQTMEIERSDDGSAQMTLHDDAATALCSGAAANVTGTGALDSRGDLVVTISGLSCDDGSEPEALSAPPSRLPASRSPITARRTPSPTTPASCGGGRVPTIQALRPRRRAPCGRSRASTRCARPRSSPTPATRRTRGRSIRCCPRTSGGGTSGNREQRSSSGSSVRSWAGTSSCSTPIRETTATVRPMGSSAASCTCGARRARRIPLYPTAPDGHQEAPGAERCAPTIDELHYETVSLDLSQPDRRGPDGIWVVSRWAMTAPFAQTDPQRRRGRGDSTPGGLPREHASRVRAPRGTSTSAGRPLRCSRRSRSCTPRPPALPTSDTRSSV